MRMYSSHSRLPFMCETTHKTERAARALMDKHDWTTKSPNQSMHGFLQRLDLERKHAGEGPTQTSLPYLQPRDNSLVRSHGKKVRPSFEAENVFECMVSLPSKSQFNQRRERGRELQRQLREERAKRRALESVPALGGPVHAPFHAGWTPTEFRDAVDKMDTMRASGNLSALAHSVSQPGRVRVRVGGPTREEGDDYW